MFLSTLIWVSQQLLNLLELLKHSATNNRIVRPPHREVQGPQHHGLGSCELSLLGCILFLIVVLYNGKRIRKLSLVPFRSQLIPTCVWGGVYVLWFPHNKVTLEVRISSCDLRRKVLCHWVRRLMSSNMISGMFSIKVRRMLEGSWHRKLHDAPFYNDQSWLSRLSRWLRRGPRDQEASMVLYVTRRQELARHRRLQPLRGMTASHGIPDLWYHGLQKI